MMSADSSTRLLREPEVAKFLNVGPRCLADWRLRKVGPPFVRISSRCVRYDIEALHRWVAERLVQPR